jgi:hypothetical protein
VIRGPVAGSIAAAIAAGAGITVVGITVVGVVVSGRAAHHHAEPGRPAPSAGAARSARSAAPAASPAAGAPTRRVLIAGGRRQPARVRVPWAASGRYAVVAGTAAPPRGRRGTVVRYLVEVERGLPFGGRGFAAAVHRILNDPRGWGSGGRSRFERTDHGPARFRVSLTSPALATRRCLPLDTGGRLSCWHGPRAIINAMRWGLGAASYGKDLASYREYVISHEVGHGLGHGHLPCPGKGRAAPVMAQQTKTLDACRRNPWPHPRASGRGRSRLRARVPRAPAGRSTAQDSSAGPVGAQSRSASPAASRPR